MPDAEATLTARTREEAVEGGIGNQQLVPNRILRDFLNQQGIFLLHQGSDLVVDGLGFRDLLDQCPFGVKDSDGSNFLQAFPKKIVLKLVFLVDVITDQIERHATCSLSEGREPTVPESSAIA